MIDEMKPENKRIRELRLNLNLSQEEFANKLNLKRNTISLIENGKRNASERTLNDICKTWSISEEWLKHGVGEMFFIKELDEQFAHLVGELSKMENEVEREIITKMFKLNKKYLTVFDKMIDSLLEIEE
ncbi:TPA: helix-turn-helix transcriptional regulator [Clostridioides difficile]|uniref:helix-turn-helix domain-containing protein n=1 Tax=Clostridioides difficile TaxID=1496 RepID=UPI0002E27FC2|nr:helix-turn-helix domain-containing protein [Clostridioides difficile]EGT3734402.1 XRE family transcriptional regulator [Clostridioides difficile]EGT3884903.1 XRE family transcriptional regulator [Clostridioides difficile]EGT3943852.1 XRE family transcriptional regulator [Clostridioides difficile]EGT3975383.1 XRE family transcriptional regulator [Clostridioides difficile]EGT4099013.1 XRE family transcriptional regulator [Clostridioides difficile]